MKGISAVLATALSLTGCVLGGDSDSRNLASAPQGLYAIDLGGDELVAIDPSTGAGTPIGPLDLGVDVTAVGADFACDGTLWAFSAIGSSTHILYSVDLATGQGTIAQTFDTSGYNAGVGFEFGPDETTIYWRTNDELNTLDPIAATIEPVASYGGSSVNLTIDPGTCAGFLSVSGNRLNHYAPDGTETPGPVVQGIGGISSLAAAPDGTVYAHSGARLYTVDTATGNATEIGPIGQATPGMAFGPDEVTCTPACPLCDPRTQGFWKRQCRKPHPSGEHERLPGYVDVVNQTAPFTDVLSVEQLCERLHPDPQNDKCEQAEAQFMATLLNRVSNRLTNSCCVSDDDAGNAGAVIDHIEALLADPNRTFHDCVEAQSLAAGLNEGSALCGE